MLCILLTCRTIQCLHFFFSQTRIQLLDLPGIIEGAAYGKGRGREVIAVARSCDMILVVLDGKEEPPFFSVICP